MHTIVNKIEALRNDDGHYNSDFLGTQAGLGVPEHQWQGRS